MPTEPHPLATSELLAAQGNPGDYLVDGHTGLVVVHASIGTWYLHDLHTGQTVAIPWGPTDSPR